MSWRSTCTAIDKVGWYCILIRKAGRGFKKREKDEKKMRTTRRRRRNNDEKKSPF